MKTTEIKRRTDEHWDNYSCPTYKPVIDVDHPATLAVEVTFGPDSDPINPERYTGRKQLDGMYWPLQRMRVRWWPVEGGSRPRLDPFSEFGRSHRRG